MRYVGHQLRYFSHLQIGIVVGHVAGQHSVFGYGRGVGLRHRPPVHVKDQVDRSGHVVLVADVYTYGIIAQKVGPSSVQ